MKTYFDARYTFSTPWLCHSFVLKLFYFLNVARLAITVLFNNYWHWKSRNQNVILNINPDNTFTQTDHEISQVAILFQIRILHWIIRTQQQRVSCTHMQLMPKSHYNWRICIQNPYITAYAFLGSKCTQCSGRVSIIWHRVNPSLPAAN